MYSFPSQDQIVTTILNGMETARSNYAHWTTDELYLSYAPSNFLTVHIAQEIGKLHNSPEIFMDATIVDILRCSLPKRDDFKNFMKQNNIVQDTVSLTLDDRVEHKSDNDSVSKAIIVVENGVRNSKDEYQNSIHNICKMIQRENIDDSTLQFGVFAFYLDISNTARKKGQKRIDEIIKSFDKIVSSYKNIKSSFKGGNINQIENIGEWCVGCYIVEPNITR